MSLSPGTTLGPHVIAAQTGAGGMGEVYRARDTRLDRVVAIKVLPSTFARARVQLSTMGGSGLCGVPTVESSTSWDRTIG